MGKALHLMNMGGKILQSLIADVFPAIMRIKTNEILK
jgi:hypothetical protein